MNRSRLRTASRARPAGLLLTAALLAGCGLAKPSLRSPTLEPLALEQAAPLESDHFRRDQAGSVSEEALQRILAAPVFLEQRARLGVVRVAAGYQLDDELPLAGVPAVLAEALQGAGLFEVATEVSADWPADRGVPGLRELAARYRTEYLLLYRHRFIDRSYTNAWGWLFPTLVGLFATPCQTLEAAGVLEATLFDVKTGTILFTVYRRVHARSDENIFYNDRKRRELKQRLLVEAASGLADEVLGKTRLLAAARPPAAEAQAGLVEAPAAEPLAVGPLD